MRRKTALRQPRPFGFFILRPQPRRPVVLQATERFACQSAIDAKYFVHREVTGNNINVT